MKKLAAFIWNFILFGSMLSVFFFGVISGAYFLFCFVFWELLGVDSLNEMALGAVRVSIAFSFIFTIIWSFTDGRKDWDV